MNKVIVVFGGAFNPPTNAHFSLGEQIYDEYNEIEKILYVPVGDQYEKKGLIRAVHRIGMLQAVCNKNPKFDVSTVEAYSPKQLCTIETLEAIQEKYPAYKIWFTIGTDNLKFISEWKKYKELISRFQLLVLERDMDSMTEIINGDQKLKEFEHNFIRVKETVRTNNSSSIIRSKLQNKKSIRYLVPDEVFEYIRSYNLYF